MFDFTIVSTSRCELFSVKSGLQKLISCAYAYSKIPYVTFSGRQFTMSPMQRNTAARQAVQVITSSICHLPGGYLWWHSLPGKGRQSTHAVTQRWAKIVTATYLPQPRLHSMALACLQDNGVVDEKGKDLYIWLLQHFFNNQHRQLYQCWLDAKKAQINDVDC